MTPSKNTENWDKDKLVYTLEDNLLLIDSKSLAEPSMLSYIEQSTFYGKTFFIYKNLNSILFSLDSFKTYLMSLENEENDISNIKNSKPFHIITAFGQIHNLNANQTRELDNYVASLRNFKKLITNLEKNHVKSITVPPEITPPDVVFSTIRQQDVHPRSLVFNKKYKIIRSSLIRVQGIIEDAIKKDVDGEKYYSLYLDYTEISTSGKEIPKNVATLRYDNKKQVLVIGCQEIPLQTYYHIKKVFMLPASV